MNAAAFALVALMAQVIPPAGLWLIANGCYFEPRRIPDNVEEAVSLAWLVFSAALSWSLAGRASFRLLTESSNSFIAIALSLICCAPGWIAGAFYFHSVLVFGGF